MTDESGRLLAARITDYGDSHFKRKWKLYVSSIAAVAILAVSMIGITLLVVSALDSDDDDSARGALISQNGSVAAENVVCSRVGVSIMQNLGGNAIDAAIATCTVFFCKGGSKRLFFRFLSRSLESIRVRHRRGRRDAVRSFLPPPPGPSF